MKLVGIGGRDTGNVYTHVCTHTHRDTDYTAQRERKQSLHPHGKLDSGEDVQVIQEAELDSRLPDGAKIRLRMKQGKINIFCEDGSRNLVSGVTNDNVPTQEA